MSRIATVSATTTCTKKVVEASSSSTLFTSTAMWFSGTTTRSNNGDNNNVDEVLDSATKWLASERVANPTLVEPAHKPIKRPSTPMRKRYTYDAPPAAPVSTPKWHPKEANAQVNAAQIPRERTKFAPKPETAPTTTWRSNAGSIPPSPERTRRKDFTTERATTNNAQESPRSSKRKRARESSSIGVEGLGQRLKRVCLKAKFHRRARQHVSSDDLTKIGTTQVIAPPPSATGPAPITPPEVKREMIGRSRRPSLGNKKTSCRSLGRGFSTGSNQDQVAFVFNELPTAMSNATSHSLVTGIVDEQSSKVQAQSLVEKDESAIKVQAFGLQKQDTKSVFLQRRNSGERVLLDESSHSELVFTESVSEDEFAA